MIIEGTDGEGVGTCREMGRNITNGLTTKYIFFPSL